MGVLLVSFSLAGLVLAISEGPQWGWADPRVLTSAGLAVGLGAVFIRRCGRHPEPAVDLQLFRSRSFTVANAATMAYAMGFFSMLLGGVLFLTGIWHYSILAAGLGLTPAPIVVALISGPAGRLAALIGFRPVIVAGSIIFAAGLCWFAAALGPEASYAAVWLPGILVIGIGIGLTFPVLSAAAVSSLPADQFAVGSAINQTSRQVGGALGVAILVAILGDSSRTALDSFHDVWIYSAAMATASGAISLLLQPFGVKADPNFPSQHAAENPGGWAGGERIGAMGERTTECGRGIRIKPTCDGSDRPDGLPWRI